MSSKKHRKSDESTQTQSYNVECAEVSEVVQVLEAFIDNTRTARDLKIVKKDMNGTDVLTVEITAK